MENAVESRRMKREVAEGPSGDPPYVRPIAIKGRYYETQCLKAWLRNSMPEPFQYSYKD